MGGGADWQSTVAHLSVTQQASAAAVLWVAQSKPADRDMTAVDAGTRLGVLAHCCASGYSVMYITFDDMASKQ
jgi:predicted RNA methylase